MSNLNHVAIYLASAILCVAIMKRLGFAAVLGYLVAGMLIGPWGLGFIRDSDSARSLAEFGIVLLLFVIGLELQPSRLWALRRPVFGLGSAQMLLTGTLISAVVLALGLTVPKAIVIGFGLAMSSTAFVLQLLAEKRELGTRHGRAGFSVLLFQDLAVIPMLAVVPLLASTTALGWHAPLLGLLRIVLVCGLLIVVSRYALRPIFQLVAKIEVPELFTATALLVVIATAVLMQVMGISVTLGAFLSGVLLADSEFRHEIEARVSTFEGLLLGLFFISVGMDANFGLLMQQPQVIAALVAGLILIKFGTLYALGRGFKMPHDTALMLAATLCQGGEFAFILFGVAREKGLMSIDNADRLILAVTVSMALTPLIYEAARWLVRRGEKGKEPEYDKVEDSEPQVVIAGFGRFAQISARILHALQIPFTALEIDPDQVALVRRFGSKAYYGDASNLELLRAAGVAKARIFLLAIGKPEVSVRIAELLQRHFPHVRILARAHNRQHVYRLMDMGIPVIERELYHSSLRMAEHLLMSLGLNQRQSRRAVISFRRLDEAALRNAHAHQHDEAKLIQTSKEIVAELQSLFENDSRLSLGAR